MKYLIACVLALMIGACKHKKLPILGEPDIVVKIVDGKKTEVTEYPKIPDYAFINHKNQVFTQKQMEGKIYVADFFFTTCPTICPVMKSNMLTVVERFKDNPEISILSHTIDPEHDTPAVLGKYAEDLGLKGDMWQFVTGDREKIYEIGQKHYLVSAMADPDAPGGFIHSGSFVLVDKNKYVRGIYDGTSSESTARLIADMAVLLEE
ncbi:SCO family protein [Dyadobacter aurulentus]|uniref:SCO family protein n=1 Tax=Dyadobacter sp. UC 10 TaxID=2605428 RepID=UPI0011F1A505|nr:SCO family protein [Dyadobacter sp. UC 10]KAA0992258.1 SCO family protein [Dyadobacter sp. UC 10]